MQPSRAELLSGESTPIASRAPTPHQNPFIARTRPLEAFVEGLVMVTALFSILALLLIIVFVLKEAVLGTPEEAISLHSLFSLERAAIAWQPVSEVPRTSVWPLLLGTLKVTTVAMAFSVPVSVGAAVFTAEFAGRRAREIIKPAVELLAGLPSVVVGFFALVVLATWTQAVFGAEHRLNAIVAGIGLAFCVCPVIFTVAEDALRSVPRTYVDASLALGASRVSTVARVIVPAAAPGILAAIMLGFGRAVGETMIVVLASGNAALVDGRLDHSTRTITATIAQELGEVVVGSTHYRVLFALGVVLFAATLGVNMLAQHVSQKMRRKLAGGA
jgi:phosphate transport system permease protein